MNKMWIVLLVIVLSTTGFLYAQDDDGDSVEPLISGVYNALIYTDNIYDVYEKTHYTLDMLISVVIDNDTGMVSVGFDYNDNDYIDDDEITTAGLYYSDSDEGIVNGAKTSVDEYLFWYDIKLNMYYMLMIDNDSDTGFVIPLRYVTNLE